MPLLPSPIPHPLHSDVFQAPDWMCTALEWVVGVDWPEGDEKVMRELANEWYSAAKVVGPLLEEADHAALRAVVALGGPEGREAAALLELWSRLGGGPEAALSVVTGLFDDLGQVVDAGANEIEGVKIEFYIELGLLLIELVILAATAFLTFGGSLAAAGPAMMATRFAIQQILKKAAKELVERAVKSGLKDRLGRLALHTGREGLQELAVSAGTQAYQIGEGNRAGFDARDLAMSFGLGTLGGAVAGVTSTGGVNAKTMSGRFGEHALRGMGGEMLAEVTIGVVTGQGVTWTSLGMAATSSGVGSLVGDGRHAFDAQLTGLDLSSTLDGLGLEGRAGPMNIPTTPTLSTFGSDVRVETAAPIAIGRDSALQPSALLATASSSAISGTVAADLSAQPPAATGGGVDPTVQPGAAGVGRAGQPFVVASPPATVPPTIPQPAVPVRPPDPGGSRLEPARFEPLLAVVQAPRHPTTASVAPTRIAPTIEDDPAERQAYAEHVAGGLQHALRQRLGRLAQALKSDCDTRIADINRERLSHPTDRTLDQGYDREVHRRNALRTQGMLALTGADLAPIANELWRIANSDALEDRIPLAQGGVNDPSTTSQATGNDQPPPVEITRGYRERGGHRPPLALHQQDVEHAVDRDAEGRPARFGDLHGRWLRLINDGGPIADPSRAINCTDVVLSVLDTWLHGRPRVAAPRTIDQLTLDDSLRPLGGEPGGVARIELATGGSFQRLRADRPGFDLLEGTLLAEGHGSCSVLVQQWPNGETHATTAHNQRGEIFYVDAQRPDMPIRATPPLGAVRMAALTLSAAAAPVDIGTPKGDWSSIDAPEPTTVVG